jgi:hypothetical protein
LLPIKACCRTVVILLGSYSTLAGPAPIVDFAPTGDDSVQANGSPGGSQSPRARQGKDREDADKVAQAIADEFGVPKEEVLARHGEGIGFGALFKLHKSARVKAIGVDESLATIPVGENGEREFRFGQLRTALTEEQRALYESGPKNLGKLVSAQSKQKDKAKTEGEDQSAKPGRSRGNGRVAPGQAKKNDR